MLASVYRMDTDINDARALKHLTSCAAAENGRSNARSSFHCKEVGVNEVAKDITLKLVCNLSTQHQPLGRECHRDTRQHFPRISVRFRLAKEFRWGGSRLVGLGVFFKIFHFRNIYESIVLKISDVVRRVRYKIVAPKELVYSLLCGRSLTGSDNDRDW